MIGQHRALVVVAILVMGGAAAGAVMTLTSSRSHAGLASECGRSASGPGFRVFSCMSGGAARGHPHPKELLVVRNDGSASSYPAFRLGGLAVTNGEVVATYDMGLVRVRSRALVPLLTSRALARALHVRPTAIMDVHHPRVDTNGNVYFVASVLSSRHTGCDLAERHLQLTARRDTLDTVLCVAGRGAAWLAR